MFEDKQQSRGSQQPQAANPGNTPNSTPSPFKPVQPQTPPAAPPQNLPGASIQESPQPVSGLEDILETVDQAPKEGAIRQPADESRMQSGQTPPAAMPTPVGVETKEPVLKRSRKKLWITLIVVIIVGGIAWAGVWAYNNFANSAIDVAKTQPDSVNIQDPSNQANQNNNQPAVNKNTNQQVVTPPVAPIDSDRDGLTDEEERLYGTSPYAVDSDNDGLTDRDEVKVFGTDPYNPDTDGDTFLDGDEVRNGYDPNGPGKLLELPE